LLSIEVTPDSFSFPKNNPLPFPDSTVPQILLGATTSPNRSRPHSVKIHPKHFLSVSAETVPSPIHLVSPRWASPLSQSVLSYWRLCLPKSHHFRIIGPSLPPIIFNGLNVVPPLSFPFCIKECPAFFFCVFRQFLGGVLFFFFFFFTHSPDFCQSFCPPNPPLALDAFEVVFCGVSPARLFTPLPRLHKTPFSQRVSPPPTSLSLSETIKISFCGGF